jgi:cobalamin biosynthetic protein CobC
MSDQVTLHHGGRVRAAAHEYRIPLRNWLDLSTGINPQGWPVPAIPAEVWQRLPEDDDGLYMAMVASFGTTDVLPVAGTQAAIQILPHLRECSRVGIVGPTYAEHANAWQAAGHTVREIAFDAVEEFLAEFDVLVVVNPNNPTGELFDPALLFEWHRQLSARGGWLVVDEAFIDVTPASSMAGAATRPGLIVLRSLGKFWGLAGLRVGFVLAEAGLLLRMRQRLGPWSVSHPARWVAQRALVDRAWCESARAQLQAKSERLQRMLDTHGLHSPSGCALFRWVPTDRAAELHEALARQAVLVRNIRDGLRFGLPGNDSGWQQLDKALYEATR